MIIYREMEYIRFGEVEYDEQTGAIRERFGIGKVERRNRKTVTVRLVLPFKSWRKTYPVGSGFRVPHRLCEPAFKVRCQHCAQIDYYTETDIELMVECDCKNDMVIE